MALSQQDLQAFWAAAPQAARPNTSGGGIGGFLQRNAGTIGSIALPTLADVLTGGLALPADAALSAIGGAGGQAISNAAQHKSLTNDLLSQAISGATGAVGGRMIGGAGSLLGKVVSKPIDSGVAKAAENATLAKTVAEQAPFAGVGAKVLDKNDLNGAISGMKNLNMAPTPANMKLASSLATGGNTSLDAGAQGTIALENALHGQKVNVGGYLDHVKQAINGEPLLGNADAKTGVGADLVNSIRNNRETNLFNGKGSLSQTANANDVMQGIRYHEGQAARYSSSAPGTPGDAIGKVHQQAADYLKGALDSAPGVNKAIADYKFNPVDAAKFTQDAVKQGASPELAQHIIQSINDAKNAPGMRSFQAPFVRMGNLANAATTDAAGALTKIPAGATGSGMRGLSTMYEGASALHGNPIAAGMLGAKALKSAPVMEKAGNILSKVRSVNNALPGKATIGQELARTAGQVVNHRQDSTTTPSSTPSGSNTSLADALSSVQPSDQTAATAGDNSPFSGGNIQKAIAADIAMTGGKHLSELLSLYNTFGKSQDTLTTNQKNSVVGEQKAIDALKTYTDRLSAVGGGSGPIAGAVQGSLLGKYIAPQANALDSQRIDIASAIAGALNPRGTVSPVTARIIADSLPSIHDTKASAQAKIDGLMQQIRSGMYSAETPVSAMTDLTSALGGA